MKILLLGLTISLLCAASVVGQADYVVLGGYDGLLPDSRPDKPQVLLALSGGGARGLAAVGVLQAFEERGIRISGIAGTSMGGIVGGLYACGYTADEISDLVAEIRFSEFFANSPKRGTMFQTRREERDHHLATIRFDGLKPHIPQGITAGQTVVALFSQLTNKANYLAGGDFNRLNIPFLTVSTDIVTGELEIIRRGSMAEALRATMAFPLAFTAVDKNGMLLMDGGMIAPIPVRQARLLSDTPSYAVAVNTTSPLLAKGDLNTPVDIANQVTSIMTADQLSNQLASADYVITPNLTGFTATDFDVKQEVIRRGYLAGMSAADSILAELDARRSDDSLYIAQVSVGGVDRSTCDRIHAQLIDSRLTEQTLVDSLAATYSDLILLELAAVIEEVPPTTASLGAAAGSPNTSGTIRPVRLFIDCTPQPSLDRMSILFEGNSIFDDSLLLEAMEIGDSLLSSERLRAGVQRVLAAYYDAGYDFTSIRDVVMSDAGDTIRIFIDEARLVRIDVENNSRSQDWLIRSYFPLSVGDPFSSDRTAQGLANVYGTDLFDRVHVDLVPLGSGAVVKINVVEKYYTQLRFGWHWADSYGSEEFVELLDDNLWGIGLGAKAHALVGRDRWHYYVRANLDRIFLTYLTAQMGAFFNRIDRIRYNAQSDELGEREEEKWGFEVRVGQQMWRLGTVTGGLTIGEARWRDRVDNTERRVAIRSINLASMLESFDRFPFPTSGYSFEFDVQLTGKVFGGNVDFTRWYSSYESYHELTPRLVYHPRVTIGASRTGLPPTEKFYMGGMKSFRGYHRDELSGDKIFLINQEIRFRLPFFLFLSAHYDLGEVYTSIDQIKPQNVRFGWGGTLALNSPLGPFEFGYGRSDKKIDQYYFRAGLYF